MLPTEDEGGALRSKSDKFSLVMTYYDQCCVSEMIYSGSSIEFSEFQIKAKVPDPCGSGSKPYYISPEFTEK